MLKLAVLLSGSGRTLDNFHDHITAGTLPADIQVVIANVADALGLDKARNYGYPAYHAKDSESTNEILADYQVDIICLAGYLKLYNPSSIFAAASGQHPSRPDPQFLRGWILRQSCSPRRQAARLHGKRLHRPFRR
jgi:phosphoribosylglycinamide formyltransferase-1